MKFQDSSFNVLKVTVCTKSVTHPLTDAPKAICLINFFKVGGINIPNETEKIVNFLFSHYKSMGTISCHSNQSSYPIGTKTQLFVPPTYRCYM